MNWLLLLSSHVLLATVALALPAKDAANKKTTVTVLTTQRPIKEKTEKPQEQSKTVKLVARKRDIPETLSDDRQVDAEENVYEGKSAEDYAKAIALASALDNARAENAVLKSEAYGDPASINEYRYYGGGDDRRKRTAIYDGLLNSPGTRPKRELQLTPDDILALLALWEQRRYYSSPQSNRWSDDDNSIDFSDNELDDDEDDDAYNNRGSSSFENLYDRSFPRWNSRDKRFMVSRRRRSSFLESPKVRVPLIRRAIL